MADDASPMADAGETFSKEYVEKLKAELAAKNEEASNLRAFKKVHDDKQRDIIAKMQPEIQTFIETLVKDNGDFAQDMRPLQEWARDCHESKSLETAMPLARVISCASAQFKRSREEASVLSDKANVLGETMKQLEELKAADSAKAQRIVELEALANERQEANTKLQDELSKAGIIKDRFDFSKIASREANATDEEKKPDVPATSGITTVTSNASRGAASSMENELLSFVRGSSKSNGSGRINQSSTAHAILGASQNGIESEIASAFGGF